MITYEIDGYVISMPLKKGFMWVTIKDKDKTFKVAMYVWDDKPYELIAKEALRRYKEAVRC